MDAAGVDAVLACSPHNVSYLLGGYRFFMFAHGTVMGASRYLPIVGYVRGAPERTFFVGNPFERGQQEHEPLWVPDVEHHVVDAAASPAGSRRRRSPRGR